VRGRRGREVKATWPPIGQRVFVFLVMTLVDGPPAVSFPSDGGLGRHGLAAAGIDHCSENLTRGLNRHEASTNVPRSFTASIAYTIAMSSGPTHLRNGGTLDCHLVGPTLVRSESSEKPPATPKCW